MFRVCLIVVLVFAVKVSHCSSADRIWLAPSKPASGESVWNPGAISQVTGKIIRLDAKELRIVVDGQERETLIASYRVLWVESDDLSDKESAALKLFVDKQYDQAVKPFLSALDDRPPLWRQQWLMMLASNAAWRSSRSKIALELVGQLDARPLPPLVISWLPVDWDGSVRAPGAADAAKERLSDPSAAVRLVAASWLLNSPSRTEASQVLNQLATDKQRPAVARLAEVLSWRTAPPPVVKENAATWLSKIDSLPLVVQTGPIKTVIEMYQSAGMEKEAARLKLSLELTPLRPK